MRTLVEYIQTGLLQIRAAARWLIGIYLPVAIIFLGVGGLTHVIKHLAIPDLIRDVAALGDLPFYAGAISQLGLLLWSAATTLCFFIYFFIKKLDATRSESLNFLLFAGVLTGYLTLDDTYMIHEEIVPNFLQIIPEKIFILILGMAMLAFLYFNRREILRSEFGLMFLAYFFFGISIAVDAIPTHLYENIYIIEKIEPLVEEGAKFAALATWIIFYARYGYTQITTLLRPQTPA